MNVSSTDKFRCSLDNTINVTDDETAATLLYSPKEKLMMIVTLWVVLLVGVLGNGIFLLTVYRIQRMQTVTNAYLTNVAISDLIFLFYIVFVFTAGLSMNTIKGGDPLTTSRGCVLIFFFGVFPYFLSVTLITLVSLERFFAICLPLSNWSLDGKSRTRNLIAVAWIIGCMLSIARVLCSGKIQTDCIIWPNEPRYKGLPTNRWTCDVISTSVASRVYCISFTTVSYVSFLLLNFIIYGAIIRALGKRDVTTTSGYVRQKEVTEVRNQVAKLLIALGIVFFICQTPERLLAISKHLNKLDIEIHLFPTEHDATVATLVSHLLLVFNGLVNPYLYAVLSKTYRDAYREALNLKNNDSTQNFGKERHSSTREVDCQ